MTVNTIPKFLLQEFNFCSLTEDRKEDFINRLSYVREISSKKIRDDQNVWYYISSLQIDVLSVLTNHDVEESESVLSVERWAAYAEPSEDVRALALSRIRKLHTRITNITSDTVEVRSWLDDWSNSLSETLDTVELTSDPNEGLVSLVTANCLLYAALEFFSWLRLAGIRD